MKFVKDYGPIVAFLGISLTIFGVVRSSDMKAIDTVQTAHADTLRSIEKRDTAQDTSIARLNAAVIALRESDKNATRERMVTLDLLKMVADQVGVSKIKQESALAPLPDTADTN